MTRDELVQINKDAFIKVGTKALDGVISSAFPFLIAPPLNLAEDEVSKLIVTEMANKAVMETFFTYTDFRVDDEGKAFVDESEKANQLEKTATPKELEQARKLADEKFEVFFNFTL